MKDIARAGVLAVAQDRAQALDRQVAGKNRRLGFQIRGTDAAGTAHGFQQFRQCRIAFAARGHPLGTDHAVAEHHFGETSGFERVGDLE